jgi:hypothetical protein
MSNIYLQRILGTFNYWKSLGTGTDLDPFIPVHAIEQQEGEALNVNLEQPANLDGALNVAEIYNIAVYKQDKARDDLFFDTVTIGTGTAVYQATDGGVLMAVSANNDAVIRQTKQFHPYFSGSPQFAESTCVNMAAVANTVKRIGLFSTDSAASPYTASRDGFYMESDGADLHFKIDKNGTNIFTKVQSLWDDPMDGTGTSGITLDASKFQALVIEYLYLGGTDARFGFLINSKIIWAHTFHNANINASTFVASPTQPVRYEIRSSGGTSDLLQVCSRVGSKGNINVIPMEFSYQPPNFVNANTVGVIYAMCGVKLEDLRGIIKIVNIWCYALTADRFTVEVRLNPTVAGTFTYNAQSDTSYSIALGDSTGNPSTNTVTGGTVLFSRTVTSDQAFQLSFDNKLFQLGSTIAGVSDELVLCVTPKGANLDVDGGFDVRELL